MIRSPYFSVMSGTATVPVTQVQGGISAINNPPPTIAPASLVYQEFKCDTCDYRSIRLSDVELHKRLVVCFKILL